MKLLPHLFLAFAFLITDSAVAFPKIFPNASSLPPWLLPNATAAGGPWEAFMNLSGCHRGDRLDGLSRLKDYFRGFGYIAGSSSNNLNFTDEFDDSLETALRTYQRNFNLNESGRLDSPTLQQILRPRCGVADIINGSTSMNSGKSPSPPPPSHSSKSIHSVGHYTFFPGTPRWQQQSLTYAFLPGNQLSDTVKAAFGRAFERWAAVTTLTFSEAASYGAADIKIGFYTGDHGDGEAFDGVLGTLAHAFSPPRGIFHLDGDENWVIGGDGGAAAVDLESVAVHEIGHLLGLGHSSDEESIMYPTISSGKSKLELAADDVNGIQQLYGTNPNYNGSATTATTASPETSASSRRGQRWRLTLVGAAFGFFMLLL